jgi:hypothetical protein
MLLLCTTAAKQVGFISIVWNDACDPKVFQLDVTLADDKNSARNRITTVPCSGDTAGVPTCMWMAAVKTEARDEYEGNGIRYVQSLVLSIILFLQYIGISSCAVMLALQYSATLSRVDKHS